MSEHGQTNEGSPLERILLLTARIDLTQAQRQELQALDLPSIDWERLVESASRHKVVPLLTRHLDSIAWNGVPEGVRSALEAIRAKFESRARFLEEELVAAFEVFAESGVPALAFKGPVLARSVYGGLPLRQAMDLDLLVRKNDLLLIRDLFAPLGFRPHPEAPETTDRSRLDSRYTYDYPLLRREPASLLELHWAFAPSHCRFPLSFEVLWERRREVTVGGRRIPALSPEDRVLVLSFYAWRRRWERLGALVDLSRSLCAPNLGWEGIFAEAERLSITRILGIGLLESERLLGAAIPPAVKTWCYQDPRLPRLLDEVERGLRRRLLAPRERFTPPDFLLMRARERRRDRISYAIPAALRIARPLRPEPRPWDYLSRLFRLLARYGPKPVTRLLAAIRQRG